MNSTYINCLDYYIPENSISFSEENYNSIDKKKLVFENYAAFKAHASHNLKLDSVVREDKLSYRQMVMKVLGHNLDAGKIIPEQINYILLVDDDINQFSKLGHFLQHEFGFVNARIIKVGGNFCANIDLAIDLASKLVTSQSDTHQALLIAGAKLRNTLNKRIIGTYGVIGDSASIAVISNKSDHAIVEYIDQVVVTKGKLATIDFKKDNTMLHFQSYYESVSKLLQKNTVKDDLKKVVLHNANQILLIQVLDVLGINPDLIYKENMHKYGHLGTTDIIMNLENYANGNSLNDPHYILTVNLGVVGTYVSSLFRTI